jgi:glycosyltransferase involved in cell wall biosynthesis
MDAFLGLYNTIVEDRKLVKTGGLLSRIIRAYEGFVLSLSDKVLIDTQQQADMLSTMYLLPVDKCVPIPVGINETIWSPKPLPLETKQFTAIFWGTFIPLHGIETIVDAARILNSQKAKIQIELIGTGQTANQIQSLLNEDWPENLLWKKKIMPHEELAKYVVKAHCILGIFGMSEKANNVIPYKLYQALALNRPVITRASKTLSSKDQDYGIYTVEPGNAEALANTLINLADNYPPKTKYTPNQFYQQSISNRVIKQRISGLMSSIQND